MTIYQWFQEVKVTRNVRFVTNEKDMGFYEFMRHSGNVIYLPSNMYLPVITSAQRTRQGYKTDFGHFLTSTSCFVPTIRGSN